MDMLVLLEFLLELNDLQTELKNFAVFILMVDNISINF